MKTQDEIIEINKKQKDFYNFKGESKNLPAKIWYYFREKTLKKIRKDIGILSESYDIHKVWFGDLSNKKVLDLAFFKANKSCPDAAKSSLALSKETHDSMGTRPCSEPLIPKFSCRILFKAFSG